MGTASISPRVEEGRYLALLQAANAIATSNDCGAASDALVRKLREVTPFDSLHLVAFDKDTNQVCFTLLDTNGTRMDMPPEDVFPLADSPIQYVHDGGEPLITLDWSQETAIREVWSFPRATRRHIDLYTCR